MNKASVGNQGLFLQTLLPIKGAAQSGKEHYEITRDIVGTYETLRLPGAALVIARARLFA
jgi:hypothetical protein